VACIIQRLGYGSGWNGSVNGRGCLGHPGCGLACSAFRYFVDIEAAKAKFAADIVKSFAIALHQFPFRTLLQPADGNDNEAHQSIFRQSMPSDGSRAKTGSPQKSVKSIICAHFKARMRATMHLSRFASARSPYSPTPP